MQIQQMFNQWVYNSCLDLEKEPDLFEPAEPKISENQTNDLIEFLKQKPKIEELNIQGCDLGDKLLIGLEQTNIKIISIGGNKFTKNGFVDLLKNNKIQKISFNFSNLTDIDIKKIAKYIFKYNRAITELSFRCNKIGNEGAIAIAELCRYHPAIKKIDVAGNYIQEEGGRALVSLRKSKEIDININPQMGCLLNDTSVIQRNQWVKLNNCLPNPQEQAAAEREVGLKPPMPTLQEIAAFESARHLQSLENEKKLESESNLSTDAIQ